ncbi:uncharacterized protein LOC128876942 isoform X2 [Hylaeus volcanicus]|uniref:uncharacterized protein LOC128876942 isoform X2 n=1 Tax=Hylaeus volcanicus TaxID=313075 RepID=UPI0023B7A196|nr:uncharacterized protein LOC128876942 isoform X2 [Hylaeus volcanicus]
MAKIRNFLLAVASVLLVVGFAHSADSELNNEYSERVSVNINELFDKLLPMIRRIIQNESLDPLEMDDVNEKLNGPLVHNGVLSMTKGSLKGLGSITRVSDVILTYENKILTLDMSLRLPTLNLNYDYFFKYGIVSRKGSFVGRFSNVDLRVVLGLDMVKYKLIFDSFKVIKISNINVELQGHVFDKVLNSVIKALIPRFSKDVINAVELRGSATIRNLVAEINSKLPRPGSQRLLYRHVEQSLENIPTTFTFAYL